jgi:hypothetical protein
VLTLGGTFLNNLPGGVVNITNGSFSASLPNSFVRNEGLINVNPGSFSTKKPVGDQFQHISRSTREPRRFPVSRNGAISTALDRWT